MLLLLAVTLTLAQEHISLTTQDGGSIQADVYGTGPRGVVLAHGGRFTKESWRKQADILASKGYRSVAIDFRGFGKSTGPGQANFDDAPFHLDVLAAVEYLRKTGATKVSLIGGSFGGSACADATTLPQAGPIDALIILAAAPNLPAERIKGRKLIILARDDRNSGGPRLPGIQKAFDKMIEPKKMILLEGSAHAQFLFGTDQSERVMNEILTFLR